MKKKIILLLTAILTLTLLPGCSKKEDAAKEPDILQIRSICDLATMECYYHNVAKSVKEAEAGLLHIGEKDRTFWIEYTGVVTLGIDMSQVEMKISGTNIEMTIPEAKILRISIDESSINEESFITSQDSLNKNKITAEDQTQAINDAQRTMEATASQNSKMLMKAQDRATKLIENYINQLGAAAGVEYNITWNYLEGEASITDTNDMAVSGEISES